MKIKEKTYWMDLETYSPTPIQHGTHAYSFPSNAKILLWAYGEGDGPIKVWDAYNNPKMPEDLAQAIEEIKALKARHVWVNGMMFDLVFLHYRGIDLPIEKCDDVRVIAYQHALPGSLAELCAIFKLPVDKAKDSDGWRLIKKFCIPDKNGNQPNPSSFPEDWAKFIEYCRRDVISMREVYKCFPGFNQTAWEKNLQLFDAKVNRRGICVDLDLVHAAIELAQSSKTALDKKISEKTNGEVGAVTQRQRLIDFINRAYNISIDKLTATMIERYLDDPEFPEGAKELLRDRLRGAQTSKAKYQVVANCEVRGRLRGCLQFRGAMRTGRISGSKFQPQNLCRPKLDHREIEQAIESMKLGTLDLFYEEPSSLLSECLRGVIIAPKGKRLCVADYSNVEGRVLAWLADEQWKLDAFEQFDKGEGHDLYKLTYGKTFNVDPDQVSKKERQIGKVEELALGYGGGAGAFAQFADNFGIDLHDMADHIEKVADKGVWADSLTMYDWAVEKKITAGLPKKLWVACNTVKQSWRNENTSIVNFWAACENAVRAALSYPGKEFSVRPGMKALRHKNWLLIRLPSGRYLVYPNAKATANLSDNITYLGINQRSRKFETLRTYGPKLAENITQAVACDLLMEAGPRLEEAGYEIVMSVHDEYVAEIPDDDTHNHREMERIMSELPSWAEGLPLVAAGFESYRYRKD